MGIATDRRRVVVTGVGALTPIGLSTEAYWNALLNGESGVGRIQRFDVTDFRVRIAGELKGFDPEAFGMARKDARRNDACTQYACCTAKMAVEDAGLSAR